MKATAISSILFIGLVLIEPSVQQWAETKHGIWANNCDFNDEPNNLFAAQVADYLCAETCVNTAGCTHFAWTNFNGGTCWMKKNPISRNQAVFNRPGTVCGITIEGDYQLRYGSLQWASEMNSLQEVGSQWTQETGGHGWGNNELQYYTDGNRNIRVANGILTIEARKEDYGGRRFTSARLFTRGFKYGVYEMRAKLPRGRGTWPAFWLLGNKQPLVWPDDGEIDVMEHVGYDPNIVHGTIHCRAYNHVFKTERGRRIGVNDAFNSWHLYQMEWTPTSITAFVDGKYYFRYNKPAGAGWEQWPFDNEHKMILNFAVGGDWGGALGVDENIYPLSYEIDYVRVYNLAP